MTARHDLDRQLQAFLLDGPTQLPDPSFDAVRDRMEVTGQRVFIGPWRLPIMNKLVPIGLGAAAVVGVLLLGSRLLSPPSGPGGPSVEPSPSPTASAAEPAPSTWSGLPEGPFVVTGSDDPVQVTIQIASSGWVSLGQFDAVSKDDDGLDAPETVGAALLAWGWPAGTAFNVYGDPCHWSTTIPQTPATTPDEIAAAFAAQALSDATAPVDVNVGGYAGKTITLHVPLSFDLPNATREEKFADCDNNVFAFYGIDGETVEARNAQGAGQIDELWILDINGEIVILDAAYGPAVPADLVEEIRALAESATFE